MCWSLLKVLLVLHAFSRAARISWVSLFFVSFGRRARKYRTVQCVDFKPHACFYSKFAKTQLKIVWFGKSRSIVRGRLCFFPFRFFDTKIGFATCNLTLDINASFSRKRNLPFFWYSTYQALRSVKAASLTRDFSAFDFTKTSRTSTSQRTDRRTFRARLPTRHTHLRHICTPQFKGTRTSPADELMTWTELYWDSTNKSTALSLSSRLFFLLYVEWHAWFLCGLILGGFWNILSAIWLFT